MPIKKTKRPKKTCCDCGCGKLPRCTPNKYGGCGCGIKGGCGCGSTNKGGNNYKKILKSY